MLLLADWFFFIGIFGFLGSTYGTAVLARALSFLRVRPTDGLDTRAAMTLDLLVAAHNEEALIAPTLSALAAAAKHFTGRVNLKLGADHCFDETVQLAEEWSQTEKFPLQVILNSSTAGKWNMVKALVESSQADWVALIDCGSLWDEKLLHFAAPCMRNKSVIGIAPSYRAAKAGLLENISWRLERSLKTIESSAGGPVSVHGASVLYRREHLLKALHALRDQSWLNDDVVVPLMLRMQFPDHRLVYLTKKNGDAWVKDVGIKEVQRAEYGRRKRMLIGNLQWMRALFWKAIRTNLLVGVLASRRVFRAFWAYWTAALGIAFTLHVILFLPHPLLGTAFALVGMTVGVIYPLQGSLERLRAAFYAGLELPLHWINMTDTSSEKIWN